MAFQKVFGKAMELEICNLTLFQYPLLKWTKITVLDMVYKQKNSRQIFNFFTFVYSELSIKIVS